jgi:hypothetical protein
MPASHCTSREGNGAASAHVAESDTSAPASMGLPVSVAASEPLSTVGFDWLVQRATAASATRHAIEARPARITEVAHDGSADVKRRSYHGAVMVLSSWKWLTSTSFTLAIIVTAQPTACTSTAPSSLAQCPTACGPQQYCAHGVLPGSCPVVGVDASSDTGASDAAMTDAGTNDAGVCQPGCPGCGPFIDDPACMPLPSCTDTTVCECLIATCGDCGGQCGVNGGEYELQCNGC